MTGVESLMASWHKMLRLAVWCTLAAIALAQLVNNHVTRSIQLLANLEKHKLTFNIANLQDQPVSQYSLLLTQNQQSRLSYAVALFNPDDEADFTEFNRLSDTELVLQLLEPLQPGQQLQIEVRMGFVHPVKAKPAIITQYDEIYVVYKANAVLYSPYETKFISTEIDLGSSLVSDHSEAVTISGSLATVETRADVPAKKIEEISIRYKPNKPFITAKTIVKEIEVSQWGNIAYEESYVIQNTISDFKGSFSRLDHSLAGYKPEVSFQDLTAVLPKDSFGIYYRDYLGNISTSDVRFSNNGALMHFKTRFPLLPSWKTDFYIGYNVPAKNHLSHEGDRFLLETRFSSSIKNVVGDSLILRVILPEGASNFKTETPFTVPEQSQFFRGTYLDLTGRPVLEFKMTNVAGFHKRKFQVYYDFPTMTILREPLYLVSLFFGFMILSVVYSRIDLSLGGKKKLDSFNPTSNERESLLIEPVLESYRYLARRLSKGDRNEIEEAERTFFRELSTLPDRDGAARVKESYIQLRAQTKKQRSGSLGRKLLAKVEKQLTELQ